MPINWEENILKTYTVSLNALWLQKNGPPGQPPRPGLEWKEETHRWVRPRTGGEGGPKRKDSNTVPTSSNSNDGYHVEKPERKPKQALERTEDEKENRQLDRANIGLQHNQPDTVADAMSTLAGIQAKKDGFQSNGGGWYKNSENGETKHASDFLGEAENQALQWALDRKWKSAARSYGR